MAALGRNRLIEPSHPDQALDQPDRLPKRKTEEHFQREADLDRRIQERLRAPPLAGLSGVPDSVGIKPNRERAPLAERGVVVGPVRRAIAGGKGRWHGAELTHWIRTVNPHH